jgi:hypothetical protein
MFRPPKKISYRDTVPLITLLYLPARRPSQEKREGAEAERMG